MMRKILFILVAFFATIFVSAENYPYRSDVLWVTTPDHANWIYDCGEKATIDIQFYKYGIPRDGTISYEIANDMLKGDKKGTAELKNGKATIKIGTKKTPGFRDLRLSIMIDGKTYTHHIKVGFSPEKIVPYTKEPADFLEFWKSELENVRKTPLNYSRELAPEYCTDKIDCYLVKLKYDSQGHSLYGYLFVPKDAKVKNHPAVLCPPGAGIKTIKEPLRHKYYAENGMLRFEIEIHGLNPKLSQSVFDDISKAFSSNDNGYIQNGLDNRDSYYMKHVFLGCVRALDFLRLLPEWDGKNLAVQGGSQGGALSIISSAIDSEHVNLCVANHPAMSDMAGYVEDGHTGGWPNFRNKSQLSDDRIKTLAYYDVVNFAPYVKAKVYMTWGYNDATCSPTTSYAVWNRFTCTKEPLITPINEHWTSEATEYGHMEWIKKNLIK